VVDGSGVGVGLGLLLGLVVGSGLVAGAVDEVRVGVGLGVGVGAVVPVAARLVLGVGWMALAPVLAGRGIHTELLATVPRGVPSRTSALNRWPAAVLTGRTKNACSFGPSGADAMVIQPVVVDSVRFTMSPGFPERAATFRWSLSRPEIKRRTGSARGFLAFALALRAR